jgi:hypothetical protein
MSQATRIANLSEEQREAISKTGFTELFSTPLSQEELVAAIESSENHYFTAQQAINYTVSCLVEMGAIDFDALYNHKR